MTIFREIRESCLWVARVAKSVRIDVLALEHLATIFKDSYSNEQEDYSEISFGSHVDKLQYVVLLDAVNFGSGWFPELRKPVEASGYKTISRAFLDHCKTEGVPPIKDLVRFTPEVCSDMFQQNGNKAVWPLMELFSKSWTDLGKFLSANYSGSLENLVLEARGSAAMLVNALTSMPMYRDVAIFEGKPIPFYKRAQITCADLHSSFEGLSFGKFSDINELTMFADNLVPHVLRHEGVLIYKDSLSRKIEREMRLPSSSREEVEIRALAVTAVELFSEILRQKGCSVPPRVLDGWLWHRGQKPEIKSSPRHRTYSSYY